MKRVVIGGLLALLGSLWALALGAYVQLNLAQEWYGSRFWSTASQNGVVAPLILSLVALALGVAMMLVEYFRRDQ